MRIPAIAIIITAGALLALCGRTLVDTPQEEAGALGAAAQQVGGGFRVIPMLELWAEARQAAGLAEWGRYRSSMEALTAVAPDNPEIAIYAADDLMLGPMLGSKSWEEARGWVRTALDIVKEAHKRMGTNERLLDALARFSFEFGDVFPFETSEAIAGVCDNAELREQVRSLVDSPQRLRYEELAQERWKKAGFQQGWIGEEGASLAEADQLVFLSAMSLRYLAEYEAAKQAAANLSGAASTPLYRMVLAGRRLSELFGKTGQRSRVAQIRAEILGAHKAEAERLAKPPLTEFRASVLRTFAHHAEGFISNEELESNLHN